MTDSVRSEASDGRTPAGRREQAVSRAAAAEGGAEETDRLVRWRLVLGGGEADATGVDLTGDDARRDQALERLYDAERQAGLGASAPGVARWLGDIRTYFPASVVSVMQHDALERLSLRRMLLEPELLASVEPDLELAAALIALGAVIPSETRETARQVVRTVVEDIERRLGDRLRQAVHGALDRASVTRRPRPRDIAWDRTIRRNLRHYQPELKTIIPETLLGHARRAAALREVIVAVDQSGSMAASVVYASIFAAVMASIHSVETRLVVFDTSVVDLTELLSDPVDVLFGTQLGGGTDINRAVAYCQSLVSRPADTIFVLISDLFEGGVERELVRRVAELLGSGVAVVVLLALSDRGAPSFDHALASKLAALGAPAFACTPDRFPELMAAVIERRDIGRWAAEQGIALERPTEG
jgi:Mg-chelatase subunit ChlD